MTVYTYFHPEIGIVFIKANSVAEAGAAGRSALGSNLSYRDSGATSLSGKAAPGSRLYTVKDGQLFNSGTSTGSDTPEMTNFFSASGGYESPFPIGGGGEDEEFDDISDDTGSATEAFSFRPAFEQGLRRAGIDVRGGGGVRGALANRAFDPLLARATMHAAFNPLTAKYDKDATQKSLMEGLTFQNYLKDQAAANSLYGIGGSQAARGLFEQARNLSGDPVAALAALGEGGGISGQFLKPATIAQGAPLANVAREAGRQRFGSFARFLPSAEDLTQTYLSYAPESATGTKTEFPSTHSQSFADFLNQRIFG